MTNIRPISDLRNHFHEISELCHKDGDPVFLTKNGKGDLVVMSLATYERQMAMMDLYRKIDLAEEQAASDVPRIPHKEVFAELRKKVNDR